MSYKKHTSTNKIILIDLTLALGPDWTITILNI